MQHQAKLIRRFETSNMPPSNDRLWQLGDALNSSYPELKLSFYFRAEKVWDELEPTSSSFEWTGSRVPTPPRTRVTTSNVKWVKLICSKYRWSVDFSPETPTSRIWVKILKGFEGKWCIPDSQGVWGKVMLGQDSQGICGKVMYSRFSRDLRESDVFQNLGQDSHMISEKWCIPFWSRFSRDLMQKFHQDQKVSQKSFQHRKMVKSTAGV